MTHKIEMQFWWVPQIPGPAYRRAIPNVSSGKLLSDSFADYDLFQLKNNIKPDYCNTGGIEFCHPTLTDGEWWGLPDDKDELTDIIEQGKSTGVDITPLET